MKAIRAFWGKHWRSVTVVSGIILVVGWLLLFRLGSLTGNLSSSELQRQAFDSSWHHLATNPLFAPYTVLQWLYLTLFGHGVLVTRLASVTFGVLSLVAFTYILRRWYGVRTAAFGSVVFVFSTWLLHAGRLGTVDAVYLWAILALLATHIAWERREQSPVAAFLSLALLAVLLYVPGMVWLELLLLGIAPRHLVAGWQSLKAWWLRALLVLMLAIIVAPLVAACIAQPSLAQLWLGLPTSYGTPAAMLHRLLNSLSYFIWKGPANPAAWLDHLPVLNAFGVIMAVAGVLFYGKHFAAPRTRLLLGMFIVGAIFFALGGPVSFGILVPIVYLVVAGGIGFVLHEWLRVFPHNPLARGIGFGLIGLAIILSCAYNLRAYFVAWPHNSQTVATFDSRK